MWHSMNFQQMPRKAEVPTLFQYQNEPKALFTSVFNHDVGNLKSIQPTGEGCIMNFDYCLAGDTKIALINGETDTLKNICDRVTAGEDVFTFSINPKTEEIEVSKVLAGRKTRVNERTLIVHLDNGERVVCSDNHKFLLRNGQYLQAKELEEGMSLMGFSILHDEKDYGVTYRGLLTNHKIVKIEQGERMDLYDIEVEKNHNFPLASGIFVHNSALEMRIAGVISGDETLLKAFQSGKDLHKSTASLVWNVPIEEVSKDLRTKAKSVNFGR